MEQRPTNERINAQPMKQQTADKTSTSHKVGDAIERAGEKVKGMGAEKLGQKIYNAGNKIEHSKDKKNK